MKVILPKWPIEGDPICHRPWAVRRYTGTKPRPISRADMDAGPAVTTKYQCVLPIGHDCQCQDKDGVTMFSFGGMNMVSDNGMKPPPPINEYKQKVMAAQEREILKAAGIAFVDGKPEEAMKQAVEVGLVEGPDENGIYRGVPTMASASDAYSQSVAGAFRSLANDQGERELETIFDLTQAFLQLSKECVTLEIKGFTKQDAKFISAWIRREGVLQAMHGVLEQRKQRLSA